MRSRAVLLGLALLAGCSAPAPRQVVLITVDALRADHLSCYGYPRETSPHLDRFAAEALRYDHATVQSPWTDGSLASMLSGRYPKELLHDIKGFSIPLNPEIPLVAELARAGDVATAAVVTNARLFRGIGFERGFDEYVELFHPPGANTKAKPLAEHVTDRTLALLPGLAERDFFLWVHYLDPHTPYVRHPDRWYDGGFPLDGDVAPGSILDIRHLTVSSDDPERLAASREVLARLYDAEIRYMDAHIQRLLEGLAEQGIADDALVILTADHGESLLDHHGYFGHGRYPYQATVRVPLVIRRPGDPPGVIPEQVPLLDLAFTIVAHLGLPAPPGMRGFPLCPGHMSEDPILVETIYEPHRALQEDGLKTILWSDGSGRPPSLYDVVQDPAETVDLAADRPDHVAATSQELTELWDSLEPAPRTELGEAIAPEVKDQIRALGYVP